MSGKERKGERTRRRILAAALHVFARYGYERSTIRAIAAEAECDKSSVIQYFGTKQQLFREAVDWQANLDTQPGLAPEERGEGYLRTMLGEFANDPDHPMVALTRAALTNEEVAELLREKVTSGAIDPMAATLTGPDAQLRAALVGAVMYGIAVQRELLRMPDLAGADVEDVLRLTGPLLRSLLATPDASTDDEGAARG